MRLRTQNQQRKALLNSTKNKYDISSQEIAGGGDLTQLAEHLARNFRALRDFENSEVRVWLQYARGTKRHQRELSQILLAGQPNTTRVDSEELKLNNINVISLTVTCSLLDAFPIMMRAFSLWSILRCTVYVK